jgi:hypothetical protein
MQEKTGRRKEVDEKKRADPRETLMLDDEVSKFPAVIIYTDSP